MDLNFLRKEFEFFVLIGSYPKLRRALEKVLARSCLLGTVFPSALHVSTYNDHTEMWEMWEVELDVDQIFRLRVFLRSFDEKSCAFLRQIQLDHGGAFQTV